MAEENADLIGGTVIQRSFVGTDLLEIVNVATVPISEIRIDSSDVEGENFLQFLAGELLGIPSSTILDEQQYRQIRRSFFNGPPSWIIPYPYWEQLYIEMRGQAKDFFVERDQERPVVIFAEDALSLLTTRHQLNQWPFPGLFGPERARVLLEKPVFEKEVDEDAVSTAMACLNARLMRPEKVRKFISALMNYDVPVGHSPSSSADSLLKLLETGKKMCLAPLAAGGAIGIGQLGTGQYVAAVLTVGTGSVMTLVLIGTFAVGTLLINRVAQQRQAGRNPRSRVR